MNQLTKLKAAVFLLGFLFLVSPSAFAGVYRVKNYTGTIGESRVHVALQFDEGGQVDGTYYYDQYREPIALYGARDAKNVIRLCEMADLREVRRVVRLASSYVANNKCPFALNDSEVGLSGIWKQAKKRHAVQLRQVGALDNVRDPEMINGTVEVPFRVINTRHLFVGIYRADDGGRVDLDELKVIDKRSGAVVQKITFPDSDGRTGFQTSDFFINVDNIHPDQDDLGIQVSHVRNVGFTDYVFDRKIDLYRVDSFPECFANEACRALSDVDVVGTWQGSEDGSYAWVFNADHTMSNQRGSTANWWIDGNRMIAKMTDHDQNPTIWTFAASADKATLYVRWLDKEGGNGGFSLNAKFIPKAKTNGWKHQ